jgi:large subunit ribosomal protein L24
MASKIKVGDTVRVIAGKDKNNEGKVVSIDHKNHRLVVEGVNMVKRHEKPSMKNQAGGIVEHEAPIDISNVMLLVDGNATRVGFRTEDGKKVRFAKKTGKTID